MDVTNRWYRIIAALYADILKRKNKYKVQHAEGVVEIIVFDVYEALPIRVYTISQDRIQCEDTNPGSLSWGETWEDAR